MAKKPSRIRTIAYMRRNADVHKDSETDEINITTLAEDACQHFDAWVSGEVPEDFFDWALEAIYDSGS